MSTFLRYFIQSNLLIALSASSLVFATNHLIGIENNSLILLVFGSTLFTYNFLRSRNKNDNINSNLKWINRNRLHIYLLMVLGLGISIVSFIFLFPVKVFSFLILITSGILSILYFGINKKLNLRRFYFLKTPIVALVWCLITVLLPISIGELSVSEHILLIVSNFLFILSLTIPFEIRDFKHDKTDENLKTIPMVYSINLTKAISVITLLLSFSFFSFYEEMNFYLLLLNIALSIIILNLNENKSIFWFDGILDFSIIIYSIIIVFC